MLPPAGEDAEPAPPWPPVRAVVRATDHDTGGGELLSALVTPQDDTVPAESSHVAVTLVVVGQHPDTCLRIGDAFTLWRGTDVARGTITSRLFV